MRAVVLSRRLRYQMVANPCSMRHVPCRGTTQWSILRSKRAVFDPPPPPRAPKCTDGQGQSTISSHLEWYRTGMRCSAARQHTELCGDDHAPVTRGRMRAQYPLPHGPRAPRQCPQPPPPPASLAPTPPPLPMRLANAPNPPHTCASLARQTPPPMCTAVYVDLPQLRLASLYAGDTPAPPLNNQDSN